LKAFDPTSLNAAALTAAHVAVTDAETRARQEGRVFAADALAYADLVVLMALDALRALAQRDESGK
jgi:hypothetical protein